MESKDTSKLSVATHTKKYSENLTNSRIIGNQAMLSIIQMRQYTDDDIEHRLSQLARSRNITEDEYNQYIKLLYSEAGFPDELLAKIGLSIDPRRFYYPTSFNANVMAWREKHIRDLDGTRSFYCPICKRILPAIKNITIDHIIPVSNHWNTIGYNSNRQVRYAFYNDISNLRVICRSCNSTKGGEDYTETPGDDFSN